MNFRSTVVRPARDNTWEVAGDVTAHGATRLITLQVDFDGGGASPMGDERVGFSAAADVNREDFGLTQNLAFESSGILVGKTARIELAIQAIAASKDAVA